MLICLVIPHAKALSLPFINSGIPFEISLKVAEKQEKHTELINLIKDGIQLQRAENITLKQYTDPAKISRFEQDIIRKILKSQGYYRFFISAKLVNGESKQSKTQQGVEKIIYQLTPGTQYIVKEIEFDLDNSVKVSELPKLSIQEDDALVAENVLSSLDKIQKHIQQAYCFYTIKVDYKAIIDHEDRSAKLIFQMDSSEQTNFGPISIKGLESINHDYIKSFIEFEEGQCFKREKINASRLSILRSNLISNVKVKVSNIENGHVSTVFKLDERSHRTIKAGIGYSTDEGAYLTSGWEHRNFQGSGEKLNLSTRLSNIRQKLLGEYFIPSFFSDNKSLTLYSEAKNEELDAYEALSLTAGARIGFERTEHLVYSLGGELKISDVNDEGETESFYLLSFPFILEWNHTNDILNPSEGYLVSAEIRPYVDIINTETKFYKTMLSISAYHTFDISFQPTLAARYSVGTITGESLENIPADERFYVGGGGSVRGYPYQSLSKIEDDDPEGGASFQQINTELRIRFLKNWGLATFVGGGFAFDDATPKFNQELLWGAGLGLRYYTAFAPFRADLAFPLDKRKDYDDDFQLYISIGQAF